MNDLTDIIATLEKALADRVRGYNDNLSAGQLTAILNALNDTRAKCARLKAGMEGLERYEMTFVPYTDNDYEHRPDPNGDWVLYDDLNAVLTEER
jgi:hypothetical protein